MLGKRKPMYLVYYFCTKCYNTYRPNRKNRGWWSKDLFKGQLAPRCPIHHILFRSKPHDAEYKRKYNQYLEGNI